ncbi:unnamed protein product, partial [Ixodes hexagonus]
LRLPSSNYWTPPSQRDKCLGLYIEAVQRDVLKAFRQRRPFRRNLSQHEERALQNLTTKKEIIIKPADKGGAIVVMDTEKYNEEGHRQLNDASFYKPLDTDPTSEYRQIVMTNLSKLNKEKRIDDKTMRSLIPLDPQPGRFYMLPKIHKQNNPGRPIISGIGTVTENISSFIDLLIKDIPPKFASYVKDTNHFLREISSVVVLPDSFLVTLDVASLYTNIPHDDGVRYVLGAYENSSASDEVHVNTLATLLRLVLELNNFEFNDRHYVQVSGTSMGTKIGPNYANIFMGQLESNFLSDCPLKPLLYKRYIDDIFLIWSHGEAELINFISSFNKVHPNIKFSHSYSTQCAHFLDVTVEIHKNRLEAKLYRKPTDRQQYLHFNSSHPRHCKTSIPYSQAHRFKRLCSNSDDFHSNTRSLRNVLAKQKYPATIIDDAIRKADELDRNSILTGTSKVPVPSETNMVLQFSPAMPNVSSILRKHYNILEQSERLKRIIPMPRVVYRRARNIGDIVTSSKITRPVHHGCRPCNKLRCLVCKHMTTTKTAHSTGSQFSYSINGNFDCDSSNVVYLLQCTACDKQYIGQTATPFRIRFNNHKAHVASLPSLPLSRHMTIPGHSNEGLSVTILQSGFRSHYEREIRESYLILKFNTVSTGINESTGRFCCTTRL